MHRVRDRFAVNQRKQHRLAQHHADALRVRDPFSDHNEHPLSELEWHPFAAALRESNGHDLDHADPVPDSQFFAGATGPVRHARRAGSVSRA